MRTKRMNLEAGNSQRFQIHRNNMQTVISTVFVLLLMVFGSLPLSAQVDSNNGSEMKFTIPQSAEAETEEIVGMMKHATQLSDKTGEAAKAVAEVFYPHVAKEVKYVLPPLGLLQQLSSGNFSEEMKQVLPITDELKKELPEMLAEHKQIVAALEILITHATAENHPEVVEFAQKLILHAQAEEEVTYPTGILIGEYIKLKLKKE